MIGSEHVFFGVIGGLIGGCVAVLVVPVVVMSDTLASVFEPLLGRSFEAIADRLVFVPPLVVALGALQGAYLFSGYLLSFDLLVAFRFHVWEVPGLTSPFRVLFVFVACYAAAVAAVVWVVGDDASGRQRVARTAGWAVLVVAHGMGVSVLIMMILVALIGG